MRRCCEWIVVCALLASACGNAPSPGNPSSDASSGAGLPPITTFLTAASQSFFSMEPGGAIAVIFDPASQDPVVWTHLRLKMNFKETGTHNLHFDIKSYDIGTGPGVVLMDFGCLSTVDSTDATPSVITPQWDRPSQKVFASAENTCGDKQTITQGSIQVQVGP